MSQTPRTTNLMWFRRDLRLRDNPALLAAGAADEVVPLFVVDPALWEPAGAPRRAWLVRSLHALDASTDGALTVRRGDPAQVVVALARSVGAGQVHIAADFGPYGRQRDDAVARALADAGIELVRTGSPYAVAPGRVHKDDGEPYRVFTPFFRAWLEHGWRPPAASSRSFAWSPADGDGFPDEPDLSGIELPPVGEQAALARWRRFRDGALADYADGRNRPDLEGTSELSAHLKYGEIHPRTLLADLTDLGGPASSDGDGPGVFRKELAWREFYADVLWQHPRSARDYLRPEYATLPYVEGAAARGRFDAWAAGRTGFPMVDAGMRQLRATGWMHNRLRMITASFLVKDLHVEWQHGARYFLQSLRDGDLASNNHGWQWVAGSGTDAAPYFRVFNPVSQGRRYDPQGDYVRRWVPELRAVAGAAAHEPWALPGGVPSGYPERLVDHAEERAVALAGYERIRR